MKFCEETETIIISSLRIKYIKHNHEHREMIVIIDGYINPLIPMISLTTNTDLDTNIASLHNVFSQGDGAIFGTFNITRNTHRGTWI